MDGSVCGSPYMPNMHTHMHAYAHVFDIEIEIEIQFKNSHYLNQWYSSGCLHLVFVDIAAWNTVNLGIDS